MALKPSPSPARGVEGHSSIELDAGWRIASVPPGSVSHPSALLESEPEWFAASSPGTVAGVLRAAEAWSLEDAPRRFDAEDWWYRCGFEAPAVTSGERVVLCLEGLATLAEVWLNGASILRSENMFVGHEVDVTDHLCPANELFIQFRSLDKELAIRRPRPRWRAPMIENQQLRWFRTTLLGRTPGWSPPAAAVGPWRPVRVERRTDLATEALSIQPRVDGSAGVVDVRLGVRALNGHDRCESGHLIVSGPSGAIREPLAERTDGTHQHFIASARLPNVERWWPHTHGRQSLYDVRFEMLVGGRTVGINVGRVGFRSLKLEAPPNTTSDFRLYVNDLPVFWRGACWTPLDAVSLNATEPEYREALTAVKCAGMNMLRVMGTATYETDVFYDLCDELGICVWHDFMFANMDYPEAEPLLSSIKTEVIQVLHRWQGRPSLAVMCGDSEGEQQAAMSGAARDSWQRPLFRETLPALCHELLPDVPYWPSSASGGAYPHQPNVGTTSYYGVGAYLRPLDDARRSEVRFATECLAFANIPDEPTVRLCLGGGSAQVHSPRWKARSPRDLGAGWDFDDVRDHYMQQLFRVDPTELRWSDPERFLALGRVASGEVMASAFAEWRRARSTCGGALVLFLRDLWPGAGWGVIDSTGLPKAAYHYLKRTLQPVALVFSDEGLSGLWAHLINDGATDIAGTLEIHFYRRHELRIAEGTRAVTIPARGALELPIAELLDDWRDVSFAFRFGPADIDLVVGTLRASDGSTLGEAFHHPLGRPSVREVDLGLTAVAAARVDGDYDLELRSRRFAQALSIEVGPYRPEEAYFHLPPGGERTIRLHAPRAGPARLRGSVHPLNAETPTLITLSGSG